MATMFPANVTEFMTPGERTVYHCLRRMARPDDLFTVWYSPDVGDTEPDFILFSPDSGLIILEVKDWTADQVLEADPKQVKLQVRDKVEYRKQPLAQAKLYHQALMAELTRHFPKKPGGGNNLPCPVITGAVFPHISSFEYRNSGLAKAVPQENMLFWDDIREESPVMKDVSGVRFREMLKERFPCLFAFQTTPGLIEQLRAIIFPVVRIRLPARAGRKETGQNEVIAAFDHDQENLAREFGKGKTLISGPAGSGKTLVLVHQAYNLLRVQRAKRVLFTCFNLQLVGYLRRLLSCKNVPLGKEGVEVIPFYDLCSRITGEDVEHAARTDGYYPMVVDIALEKLHDDHPLKGHWDAILVDEGQDFSPEMAQVILSLLPGNGTLTVVQDLSQRIFLDGRSGWEDMGIEGLRRRCLSRQYRSTRALARFAARLTGNGVNEELLSGAEGRGPVWVQALDWTCLVSAVADRVAELRDSGVPLSEIAVLVMRNCPRSDFNLPEALVKAIEARGVLARWASKSPVDKRYFDITTDSVTISNVQSIKGVDFAHVFLLGLDQLSPERPKSRQLAYVGVTRAREALTLGICKESGLVPLLKK